ncbi:Rsm1-like [Geosmithia morbida]|uniref:Rsm1-like n=1 Tax=Geosmithia morbida TaxID=1094350 RepID=A0A9P4YUJ4_9HYPO|nr:Rsm1-like [Geosmithia morbida]KAF4122077.1 Rsm1-like [Geosmithia morbida]
MNATKRKFNTLLQGLGSPRQGNGDNDRPGSRPGTAPAKPPQTAEEVEALLQKRRRLGLPQSNSGGSTVGSPKAPTESTARARTATTLPAAAASEASPSLTRTGSGSSVVGKRAVASQKKVEEKPLARFCPSDRSELLKRLATFNDITDWTPKPDRVSEIEWAKRGWVCHGKETVRCVLCHKELVVKVNKKDVGGTEVSVLVPSEIEGALVDKYAELITDSHLEDCLWRRRGCDGLLNTPRPLPSYMPANPEPCPADTLLRLHIANTSSAVQDLKERYQELCSRESFLPYEFNLRLPVDLDLDKTIKELPPDFFQTEAGSPEPPNRTALALALMGWQGLSNVRIGAVSNSASCHTCLRRLGLWMFKSREVGDSGEVIVPAPMDHLDAVREHRFFCPWKNADTQKLATTIRVAENEPQPAWKILLQTLHNDSHLRSVYAGKPKSHKPSASGPPSTPARGVRQTDLPKTPGTSHGPAADMASTPASTAEDEDKEQEIKDKERWARLKRVKSLFDMKGSRRLSKAGSSRPGTSQSIRDPPAGA